MSKLLEHTEIRRALSNLGINNPERNTLYLSLWDLFIKASGLSREELDMVTITNIVCSYPYKLPGKGNRITSFRISGDSEHHISQIFISIIFMKFGFMDHKSVLNFNEKTPLDLIKIAEHILDQPNLNFGNDDDDREEDDIPF